MLNKISGLGRRLSQKSEHPLDDPRGLRRIIAELPADNAFKALDEIAGWLESLQISHDIPLLATYEAASQLEDAACAHLKRLSREYLNTVRLSRADERRLWSINHGFWSLLAVVYERCRVGWESKVRGAELLKPHLAALATRLMGALGAILKWEQFHYGPTPGAIWLRLGKALSMAEAAGLAEKHETLPFSAGVSTPQQEYLKALVFQAASMDSLLPLEIDLAERIVAYFLPAFVLSAQPAHDCVYWVDLQLAQPPLRMARLPAQLTTTLRFFKPGPASAAMQSLLENLEQGGDVPVEIPLGEVFTPRVVLPILRHLTAYLAAVPPQRRHDRHKVKHRMSVLHGLINAFVVFSGDFGGRPAGLQMESWVVENVSRGGFGVLLNNIPGEWLKIGALIVLQPEGGDNWLLGIVRRYHRETESEARVGIEALARQVVSVEVTPRRASRLATGAGMPALLIDTGGDSTEVRLVLPLASFDLRENLEYRRAGESFLLEPLSLLEQATDYELASYRQSCIPA